MLVSRVSTNFWKNFKPKINLKQNIHVMKYLRWIFHHMKAFGQAVYFFFASLPFMYLRTGGESGMFNPAGFSPCHTDLCKVEFVKIRPNLEE